MDAFPSSLVPNAIVGRGLEYRTKVIEFESGNTQRFAQWHLGRRTWRLSWNMMKVSDYATLEAFFDSQVGQLRAWYLTDTRVGVKKTVRFNADKLEPEFVNARFVNVAIEVVEC